LICFQEHAPLDRLNRTAAESDHKVESVRSHPLLEVATSAIAPEVRSSASIFPLT